MLFVLPDGRSAEVSVPSARLICDRLWDFGIAPGAATAAVRISEMLYPNSLHGSDLAFSEREALPVLVASEVAPPSWRLADPAKRPAAPAIDRVRLLAHCDRLIDSLNGRSGHGKPQSVIADVERFRDNLRSAS